MDIRVRLGISVAIAALFSIAATEFLQDSPYYAAYQWHLCAALWAMGPVLFLVGRLLQAHLARRRDPEPIRLGPEPPEAAAEHRPPFLLWNLSYWGVMLAVFGLILIFIVPTAGKAGPAATPLDSLKQIAARTVSQLGADPTPAAAQPVAFPALKLQGLIYCPPASSVLVNGRTYQSGDTVGGAIVGAITRTSVTLEYHGQTQVLVVGRAPGR